MSQSKNSPIIATTNPLHYTYFFQAGNKLPVVGSSNSTLMSHYAERLLNGQQVELYPVGNRLEEIIEAHEAKTNANGAYITWKAVEAPGALLGNQLSTRAALERKAAIRTIVDRTLFPDFEIIEVSKMEGLDYPAVVEMVGSQRLVLQVDFSTGGRGTYFIDNESDFVEAFPYLAAANATQRIVASKRIVGKSFAIQCFIEGQTLRHMNWWHRDLVNLEGVCNQLLPESAYQKIGTTRYCGAVLQNIPQEFLPQIRALTDKIGPALVDQGYRGIFGMDIVVEQDSRKIYLIEVNARYTAVSHVYATAMHAVGCGTDFLTEDVRQLLGEEKAVFKALDARLPEDYFYLKLQNLLDVSIQVKESCELGVYRNSEYQRFGFGVAELKAPDEVVIIPEDNISIPQKPGSRIFSVVGVGDPIGPDGKLKPEARQMLDDLRTSFTSI